MGGAIARGLAKGSIVQASDVCVSNPSQGKLDALKAAFPELRTTNNNAEAVLDADLIILAVKPWLVETVLNGLSLDPKHQMLASVAGGFPFARLVGMVGERMTLFRIIPNTAISEGESMTLISSRNATREQEQLLLDIFSESGLTKLIPEEKMEAATALTSCGIAYVFQYIRAAMQAGVELGLYPKDAQQMVAQSVKGAAELLLNNDTHPSVEIDKVCTPGGMTIKGINELAHAGFDSAIIRAMKACLA